MENFPFKLESLQLLIGEFSIFPLHFEVFQFADEHTQLKFIN